MRRSKTTQHVHMPELPEVETVRQGLVELLGGLTPHTRPTIDRVELRRPDLRGQIPPELPQALAGQPITSITRRAKYLLWQCGDVGMLNHLGMTGSWREDCSEPQKHDHVIIHLADGRRLVYRDPRRFGRIDRYNPDDPNAHIACPIGTRATRPRRIYRRLPHRRLHRATRRN